jgi:hypothetical protein
MAGVQPALTLNEIKMKTNRLLAITLCLGFGACEVTLAQAKKTELKKEAFVEKTTTDFVMSLGKADVSAKKVITWHLAAPSAGDYTLICFLNGSLLSRTQFKSPGDFKLNLRGTGAGSHRITIQLVDAQG